MKRRYLHPGRAVDHLGWGACFNLTSTVKIWSLKSLQITSFQISLGSLGVLLWSSRTVSSATKLHPTFHQHAGRWWLGLDFWVNCYFEGATATFFLCFSCSHTHKTMHQHTLFLHIMRWHTVILSAGRTHSPIWNSIVILCCFCVKSEWQPLFPLCPMKCSLLVCFFVITYYLQICPIVTKVYSIQNHFNFTYFKAQGGINKWFEMKSQTHL